MTRESTLTPFDIADAREAVKKAGQIQASVEESLREASRDLAEKERVYREALATAILDLRTSEDKPAWTACEQVARGGKLVARLRFERDVAEGVMKAVEQAAFRRGADRRDLSRLVDWSARRDLADDQHGQREPDAAAAPFGRRAA